MYEKIILQGILKKTSKDLLAVIDENKSSAVIGSILTSIGMMYYKNEKLLNALTNWVLQNSDKVRPQDISALLMTLATVGYCPNNFSRLYEVILLI